MQTWAECVVCSVEATVTVDYEPYCAVHGLALQPKAVAVHVCRHCEGAISWSQYHEPADDVKCWCWLPRATVRRLWVRTASSCHPPSGQPRCVTKAESRRKRRQYLARVSEAVGE